MRQGSASSWTTVLSVLGVVALVSVIALVLGIYNTSKLGTQHDKYGQCTCYDRQAALNVWKAFNNGLMLINTDPVLSTQTMANYFAPTGIWSFPFQAEPVVGPQAIYDFFIPYATDPGEVNISVVDKSVTWDCVKRTLTAERIWKATLNRTRSFTPGSTAVLPINTTYSQDDLLVVTFNCNLTKGDGLHSITYLREYYDNTQYVATYTEPIATSCPSKYKCN